MTDIYDQHSTTFKSVSAYVVALNGERVATIAFKFPKDGAGRLTVYAHWLGVSMVKGTATGYGYDKCSAALANASRKITGESSDIDAQAKFVSAIAHDCGSNWDAELRRAGFDVLQAV